MADALAIDLPGHGLSSRWAGAPPTNRSAWQAVIDAAALALGATQVIHTPLPVGEADRLFPDLTPDRFGSYLTTAWSIVRARLFYEPWYEAKPENAIPFDHARLAPAALAREHRALIRSTAAREMLLAFRPTGD